MTVAPPKPSICPVLVIGAGPVGMTVALRLARAGIRVDVIEKEKTLEDSPRAAGYYGAALIALARAGVLEKAKNLGFTASQLCWRKPLSDDGPGRKRLGDIIARMPYPIVEVDTFVEPLTSVILPQSKLTKLLYEEAISTGLVSVHFGTTLIGIEDHADSVSANVEVADTGMQEIYTGLFLVGADGGRSTTRKLLGISFKGHSWPERLIAIDCMLETTETILDSPTSFIVDPVHFGIVTPIEPFELGKKTRYRVAAALDPNDTRTDEELKSPESLKAILDQMAPGPRPVETDVLRVAPYRIHQLCASTFRQGRCVLAGDAAHLNNPFGGMGLSSGLLDADALADSLELILKEGKQLSLLDIYSNERARVFQFFVDPFTTQNKLRCAANPNKATEDWLIKSLVDSNPVLLQKLGEQFISSWRTDVRKVVAQG